MAEKETITPQRYYWLKLHDDFFESKRIKKLRKIAGGDTYTIIYLKMQLKAIKTDGLLEFTGLEEDFADELALDIDEDVDNVRITINYLLQTGLLEQLNNNEFSLPYVPMLTGSETAAAERMRKSRDRQKQLECNNVTSVLQNCCVEKEIEKEIEKDKEKYNKKKSFTKPSIEEIQAYINEKQYKNVNAEKFYYYYESKGWLVGKTPMKNWKASVVNWEHSNYNNASNYQQQPKVVYEYKWNKETTPKEEEKPKKKALTDAEAQELARKMIANGDPRDFEELSEALFWGEIEYDG